MTLTTPAEVLAMKAGPKLDVTMLAYNSRTRAWIGTHFGGRDYYSDAEDFEDAVYRLESDLRHAYELGRESILAALANQ